MQSSYQWSAPVSNFLDLCKIFQSLSFNILEKHSYESRGRLARGNIAFKSVRHDVSHHSCAKTHWESYFSFKRTEGFLPENFNKLARGCSIPISNIWNDARRKRFIVIIRKVEHSLRYLSHPRGKYFLASKLNSKTRPLMSIGIANLSGKVEDCGNGSDDRCPSTRSRNPFSQTNIVAFAECWSSTKQIQGDDYRQCNRDCNSDNHRLLHQIRPQGFAL